jgi:putative glutamine amidotransferase
MRIAITASKSKTQYYINSAYIEYLLKAGYLPHIISTKDEIPQALEICNGIVLPGGIDLNPMHYGYANFQSFAVDQEKDAFERLAFHSFRQADKPVFGICRGFQLIIMEFLNKFPEYEKVLNFVFHINHHAQTSSTDSPRGIPTHFVEYVSKYLYGKNGFAIETLGVNSMHHQCLIENFSREKRDKGDPAAVRIKVDYKNFTKSAWTKHGLKDNEKGTIVEGFVINKWGGAITAVQWHPEELQDCALLQNAFGNPSKIKINEKVR